MSKSSGNESRKREYEIKPSLAKKLQKISKKDNKTFGKIVSKIEEICESGNIQTYKNLRYNMKDSKRVHIGHFVLVFSYDKKNNFVSFEDFDHHDNIYKK